jgi:hypothetical protein
VVELAKVARDNRQQVELALGVKVRANDSDTALVGALLRSFGITTTPQRTGSTCRMYGADSQQLSLVRAAADRLRRKGSGLAPPSAGKGAALNNPACGGAPSAAPCGAPPPSSLWSPPAAGPGQPRPGAPSCEQLPLAVATDGHLPAQRAGGAGPSSPAPQRSEAPAHNPWRVSRSGPGAAAIRRYASGPPAPSSR